ncbi:MAG: AAA family ATPase [Planctomycetales bacterium]|nr:AAA family ATPase [Planctomycetales bacterium]
MKLRELDIEHFGVFSGQRLEFDPGFSLVFGPNEAGKSTLLQLIRELLFGFKPLQNPYVFDDHAGEMAATGLFDMSDGTQLRFRRRKGKKNEVVGKQEPSGQEVDMAALSRLVGGASKELYEQVFGFSLRELTEADESLKRANLTEALYGGGLGGLAHFQSVQAELQTESDGLFTSRGRSKQLIHKLLGEIKERSKDLKARTLKPRDFELLVREAKEAKAAVDSLRQTLETLRGRKAHLDRLADAIEPWARRRHAERELAELSIPDTFPIDGGEQYSRLKIRRTEVANELESVEQELNEEAEQLASLQLAPELLANEAAIRELEQQITQIVGFRRDMPLRQQASDAIKSSVRAQLQSFSPDWNDSHLERFRTTLAQRQTVDRLKSELEELLRKKSSATAERRAVESDIKALHRQLEQGEMPETPDGLASLLDKAPLYQRNLERLLELHAQLDDAEAAIETLVVKLNAPLRAKLDLRPELSMPMAATVIEFRERLRRSEKEVTDSAQLVKTIKHDCEQKQEQLAQLDAGAAVPDREQLLASRDNRDSGWQLLRERLLDTNKANDEAAAKWLPADSGTGKNLSKSLATAYEQSVQAADALADERQDKAEQAAACDQLKYEVGRLTQRLEAAEQNRESQLRQHEQVVSEWESLWTDCPFAPLSPTAMLDWLQGFNELTEARSKQKQLRQRADSLQTMVSEFEKELSAAFPKSTSTPAQQLVLARERQEAVRDSIVRRRTYEEQLPQKQEVLRSLDEQLTVLEDEHHEWQTQWENLLDQFKFPRDWDVHLASKILGGLVEARNEWDKAIELDKRIGDMSSGIAAFTSAVQSLCGKLAPKLVDFVPEIAMKELQSQLDAAKIAHRDNERLQGSCGKLRKRHAAKKEQLAKIDAEFSDLLSAAGTRDEAAFEQVALAAKRKAELTQVSREASSQIIAIRRTEDEEKFDRELQDADADSIASEQHHLAQELKKADTEYNLAFKKATLLDEQREKLDGASLAADVALGLESTRSQLAVAVDRWAPLVLAQALMKQSIKKFEREHQPAMLAEVERLLRQMTVGRYTAIERKLDEHGTLLVVDEAGKRKEPHQLSTGTREQLYLAIRLAYIHHYCQDTEPLPIVMDDVLVNFDAERAKQTLEVLSGFSQQVQIIFLTCHHHMIDLVSGVEPHCQPIILPGGALTEGKVVASRTKKRISETSAT